MPPKKHLRNPYIAGLTCKMTLNEPDSSDIFRIFLGFALSVLVYSAFISSVAHAGFYVSYYVVFLIFLGTLCAATAKPLWRRATSWMRHDGQL